MSSSSIRFATTDTTSPHTKHEDDFSNVATRLTHRAILRFIQLVELATWWRFPLCLASQGWNLCRNMRVIPKRSKREQRKYEPGIQPPTTPQKCQLMYYFGEWRSFSMSALSRFHPSWESSSFFFHYT